MKKFKVSVQIGFYSEPYEYWTVYAHDKKDALTRVDSMFPKYVGHRFFECGSSMNKRHMGDNNREVRRCVADLKEHFGVE